MTYPDLSINVDDLTNNLTVANGIVIGTGILDKILVTLSTNLQNEYNSNRITGADYATAYLGMVQVALDRATAILLGAKASEQAAKAEAAKVYLTEAQIAQLDYQTANILPKEATKLNKEATKLDEEIKVLQSEDQIKQYQLTNIFPEEVNKLQEEIDYLQSQDAELLANGLKDRLIKDEQIILVSNQADTEAAKTLLVNRQTEGFDDDAKQKLLKQALDAWSVSYSVSETADSIPTAITKHVIDSIAKSAMDSLEITKTIAPLG